MVAITKKKKDKDKKEAKTCNICNMPIDIDNGNYCVVDTYSKGEFLSKAYYHIKCFREKLLKKKQITESLANTNKLMGKIGEKFFGQ